MTDKVVRPQQPGVLEVKAFGNTDRGRVRATNEDHFMIAELTKAMRIWHTSLPEPAVRVGEERGHLFLVADGMGGHLAGETASALAVVAIEQFTLNTLKWFFDANGPDAQRVLVQFQNALRQANTRIREEAVGHPELSGMGTTVTMAYQLAAELCIVHVGDSRAYILRHGELQQITRDHTFTAELVRRGELRPDEVARHRLRHVITNVVGGPDAGLEVEAHALVLEAGDRLLLCTDGLTEMLNDEGIQATLLAEPDPEAACTKLIMQANEAGGRDNITAIIAMFETVL